MFSDSTIIQTISNKLNNNFNSFKIKFIPVYYENVNNDSLYNENIFVNFYRYVWSNTGKLLHPSIHNQENALAIYLFNEGYVSFVKHIGGLACVLSGYDENNTHYSFTNVLLHEMGHALGLLHTFNATNKCSKTAGWTNCAELVNGSNSHICDDYVDDTPADVTRNFRTDSCIEKMSDFAGCVSPMDENGEFYIGTNQNIMDYYSPDCMNTITNGQATRIKKFASNWIPLWSVIEKNTDTAILTLTATPTAICNGNAATLNSTSNKPNNYFYTWDFIKFYDTIPTNYIVYPNKTQTYQLTMLKNGCSNHIVASTTVIVDDNIILPKITGDSNLCINNNYSYINAFNGGIWSVADTTIAEIDSTGNLFTKKSGVTKVIYTIITPNNCFVATIKNIFIADKNSNIQIVCDSNFCLGVSKEIKAEASSGLYNFIWNTSDTGKHIFKSFNSTGIKILEVTATSPCGGVVNTIKNIVVNNLPTVQPITSNIAPNNEICLFTPYQLNCSAPTLATAPWSTNDPDLFYSIIDSVNGQIEFKEYGRQVSIFYKIIDTNLCEDNASVTLNIFEPIITITGQDTICVHDFTNLVASKTGGSWSSSNANIATVDSNGMVTGNNPGSCIINYTYSYCNTNFIFSKRIVVKGIKPSIITVANVLNTCDSTYTFSANVSGIWSSSNTVVASINQTTGYLNIHTSGSTVISFTPTNVQCGINNISRDLTIINCLTNQCDTNGYAEISNNSAGNINNASVFGNDFFKSTKNIYINGTVEFNNIQLLMAKNKGIFINDNSTLIIKGSHIFNCDSMWQGIKLLFPTSRIIIDGNFNNSTLIEDADTAILLHNNSFLDTNNYVSNISISNTIFNRNNISIAIHNTTSYNGLPFNVSNCIFTSRNLPFSSTMLIWPNISSVKAIPDNTNISSFTIQSNYIGNYVNNKQFPEFGFNTYLKNSGNQKPSAAIWLNNVQIENSNNPYLTIGSFPGYNLTLNTYHDNLNIFDNLQNSIISKNTSCHIINSIFQQPVGEFATAIHHISGDYLNVSSPTGCFPNAFFNFETAIKINSNGTKNSIQNAIINNCVIRSNQSKQIVGSPYGKNGIYVETMQANKIEINNNEITNINNGITVFLNPFCLFTPNTAVSLTNKIVIQENTIQQFLPVTPPTGNEYVENAITLMSNEMWGSGRGNNVPLICNNNVLNNVIKGISATNFKVMTLSITNNKIKLSENLPGINTEQFGIKLEGGVSHGANNKNIIEGNNIIGYNNTKNTTGILLKMQANCNVGCNTVQNNKHGFRFYATNPEKLSFGIM